MRPLSNDLRERVVAAVGAGDSCRSVAARFGIVASTVVKWSQPYRATGSVTPGKNARYTGYAGAIGSQVQGDALAVVAGGIALQAARSIEALDDLGTARFDGFDRSWPILGVQ